MATRKSGGGSLNSLKTRLAKRIAKEDMGAKASTALINREGKRMGLSRQQLVSWGASVLLASDRLSSKKGGSGSTGG